MNRLRPDRQAQVIAALVEGSSVRAVSRMTGVAKGTILKLLGDLGETCAAYQEATLRNLYCRRIQCDEVWAFCHAKAKNVPQEKKGQFGYGDVWTSGTAPVDPDEVRSTQQLERYFNDSPNRWRQLAIAQVAARSHLPSRINLNVTLAVTHYPDAEAIDALTPDGYYNLYGIRGQGAGFEESEVDKAKRGGTALLSLFFPPEFSLEVKCIP